MENWNADFVNINTPIEKLNLSLRLPLWLD